MPVEVIMPKVDMDMASGKILSWHVAEGAAVTKGEPLFDIETDKAAMEVEAAADGILHHVAPEGTEIAIGQPCAWLYADGEKVGDRPEAVASVEPPALPISDVPPARDDSVAEAPTNNANIRATPQARSAAREGGMDIATITGTGPRGRVQAADVRAALEPAIAPVSFRPETGALAVTRSKSGTGTPIVLIHGFASDATSWAPLEAHLKHRPLIRIDLPGHGKSPKLEIDSFAELVKLVRKAFDGLNLEQADLIGHSLGGGICMALADTRQRNLSSLTLIAPAGLGPEINGDALSGICRARVAESLGPWLRLLVADEDTITKSYVRLAMANRSDPQMRAAQSALSNVLFPDGVQAFDLRAALDRIEVPTRILWGKRDAIIPWRHALQAPGRVGLHLFDGIGHMPQIECPDAISTILTSRP